MADQINIRPGKREDLPRVLELIKELAEYERAADQVSNTLEMLERDGFGPNPVYGFFVAENGKQIVGISLYYWRYSTWKGKRLWLEDLVVSQSERGRGVGKMLLDRTIKFAYDEKSSGIMWQVLDWNEPAINFYKKYGANISGEWHNCVLEAEQVRKLIEG